VAEPIKAEAESAEGGAYVWAFRISTVSLAALVIVGGTAAWLIRGSGGLWGALAAVGIAAVSGLVTQVAMIVGYRRKPTTFVGIVAGSWLAKMIIIAVSVILLKGVHGIDRGTFGTLLLLGVGATLAVDMFAVRRARIPYTG
jgi:fumarate reductase subunit D